MRKIFALFLCLMFSLMVMVGCKSNKSPQKQPAATTTTQQSVKPANNGGNQAANVAANTGKLKVSQTGTYSDKEHVAQYIYQFKKLPSNFITKNQAKKLGWQTKGTLDKVAPGKSIGGDRYGDYEGKLPKKSGRSWTECDIDYVKGNRNAKRIVFSNDGLIYYTGDHYKTFNPVKLQ